MIEFSETLPTADRWTVSRRINAMCPPHWEAVRLGEIAGVQNGFPFESKFFNATEGFPIIRIRDVGATDTATRYSGPYDPEFIVHAGDILVGMDGEFRCRRWTGKPALLNQRVCRIRVTAVDTDERFVFAFLQPYISAVEAVTSSITVKHLSSRTVEQLEIALPPFGEQRRIVAKLDELLASSRAARATLDAVPALAEGFIASVMERALRGEITPSWRDLHGEYGSALEGLAELAAAHGARERRKGRLWGSGRAATDVGQLPPLPPTWAWTQLSQLGLPGEVVQIGPMSMKSSEFVDDGRLVLNVGCIRDGWVDTSKADHLPQDRATDFERYALRTNDVIFTRSGSVGRCALLPSSVDGALMTFHLLRVRVDPRVCLPEYLLLALRGSASVAQQIRAAAIGATRAGFNTRLLEDLWVPLAPVAEQAAILEIVEQHAQSARHQQMLVDTARLNLSVLNEALLAKAFRGELVPQDPAEEPASVLLERIRAERVERPVRRARHRPAHT